MSPMFDPKAASPGGLFAFRAGTDPGSGKAAEWLEISTNDSALGKATNPGGTLISELCPAFLDAHPVR
jgi:hypothetical protein